MKFVRRVAFWATGGGHLKYYINWPEKCSTPQTPSNRSFLTPKTGHFGGGSRKPPFSRFFRWFSPKLSKSKVSRFLLNAWSLWTRLCCWYMHHTWVLSSSVNDPRLRSLSTPSLLRCLPMSLRISRSSFDSDTKNNVRPDYSSFFVHSLKSL